MHLDPLPGEGAREGQGPSGAGALGKAGAGSVMDGPGTAPAQLPFPGAKNRWGGRQRPREEVDPGRLLLLPAALPPGSVVAPPASTEGRAPGCQSCRETPPAVGNPARGQRDPSPVTGSEGLLLASSPSGSHFINRPGGSGGGLREAGQPARHSRAQPGLLADGGPPTGPAALTEVRRGARVPTRTLCPSCVAPARCGGRLLRGMPPARPHCPHLLLLLLACQVSPTARSPASPPGPTCCLPLRLTWLGPTCPFICPPSHRPLLPR